MQHLDLEKSSHVIDSLKSLLNASELHLQALFDHSVEGIITCNDEGVIQTFNPAAAAILGYSQDEAIGKNFWVLLSNPQQGIENSFSEDLKKIDPTKLGHKYQAYAKHQDGRDILIELNVISIGHRDQNLFLGIFHDLTFRKRAEESLRSTNILLDTISHVENKFIIDKSHANIEDIFQQLLTAAIAVTSSSSGFIAQYSEGNPSDLIPYAAYPDSLKEAVKESTLDRAINPLVRKVIKSEEPLISSQVSDKIPIHFLGIPLINKDKLIGVMILCNQNHPYDEESIHLAIPILQTCVIIWEDYEKEQERIKAKEMLKERDTELTSYVKALAIQNQELESARDQAQSANRAKSAFLANMSHEIRTPLNGIMGMTELLLQTELNEKQNKFAKTAYTSAQHLLTLINDLLDLSKIEAGQLVLELIPFNLIDLIEAVTALLEPKAEEKGLTLGIQLPENLPRQYLSDPTRLQQVLMNLVGNAIKFTGEGSVTIHVKILELTSEEASLRFEVIDTGVGVPKDKQVQLFDKFTQADTSTTRKYGGTGLGLAISKKLIEKMGGTIGLISEEDKGATFWFEVWLSIPDVKRVKPSQTQSPHPLFNRKLKKIKSTDA